MTAVKKQIIQASSNSLYTLNEDFERSTQSVMQEQEAEMLEKELLDNVLKESVKGAAGPKTRQQTAKQRPSLETILKMASMGYPVEEVFAAYRPNEAGVEGMIDRILQERDRKNL